MSLLSNAFVVLVAFGLVGWLGVMIFLGAFFIGGTHPDHQFVPTMIVIIMSSVLLLAFVLTAYFVGISLMPLW